MNHKPEEATGGRKAQRPEQGISADSQALPRLRPPPVEAVLTQAREGLGIAITDADRWAKDQGNLLTLVRGSSKSGHFDIRAVRKHKAYW